MDNDQYINTLIENELNDLPYENMSNRTKRYCKRNLIKLYSSLQNRNTIPDPNHYNVIIHDYYNIRKFVLFVHAYFVLITLFFMYFFFLKYF